MEHRDKYEDREYTFHSVYGFDSLFATMLCENERHWRLANGSDPNRMSSIRVLSMDECHNAWIMPNVPSKNTTLNNLHKYEDYE
mmetsp:Transcript_16118/g.15838  ORF Transcript_16118/g.15838 Transcript_16118/m.15838 type:complete len:84 (+) Transcript_16118:20-271(+)